MSPSLYEYLGFVVAAVILGWAIFEISRRYFRQRKVGTKASNTWVKLDSSFKGDIEEALPDKGSEEEEESELGANIQIRAQHNGYHSESKKLL